MGMTEPEELRRERAGRCESTDHRLGAMGDYSKAAEFYDLLYTADKDYDREAELVAGLIRDRNAGARTLLDVGCGTGAHALGLVDQGFEVTGLDIEPAFVEIARSKCPDARFVTGDMRHFDLESEFDAVVCLFSAIGYALTLEGLADTLRAIADHLAPGGVVVVDPWFEPSQLTDGHITTTLGSDADTSVVRMSRTVIDGSVSTLEFEYLIGTAEGIERRTEIHRLGLFTEEDMTQAFRAAGFAVERIPKALRTRGIHVGVRA